MRIEIHEEMIILNFKRKSKKIQQNGEKKVSKIEIDIRKLNYVN